MQIKPFEFEVFTVDPINESALPEKTAKNIIFVPFGIEKPEDKITTYNAQELAAAEIRGYERGMKDGLAKIDADKIAFDQKINDSVTIIATRMEDFLKKYQIDLRKISDDSTKLAFEITRKMAGDALKENPQENIIALVNKCMNVIAHEPSVTIIVNPAIASAIKERTEKMMKEKNFTSKIEVKDNPSVTETDCLIQWANGGAEINMSEKWQKIEEILGLNKAGSTNS